MFDLKIKELKEKVLKRELKAEELVRAYLEQIKNRDGKTQAYLEVFEQEAIESAKKIDADLDKGVDFSDKKMLAIPIALKDNILYKGHTASAASKMLENYKASYSATVTERLQNHGAIFLGRTNMDEFAMGSSTESSAYQKTKNPHDLQRVPGGSSGGSAASVSDKSSHVAMGTDTGGSIRQPASFCGVVGFKPSYGTVSRHGLIAMGSSLDQAGPLARSAEDAKEVFLSIYGEDGFDATAVPKDFIDKNANKKIKKIGVPRKFLEKGVESYLLDEFENLENELKSYGYELVDIDIESFDYALAAYYIIMPAEVSTNLARFDGLRYGLHVEADSYEESFAKSRAQGFGQEVKRRILLGTFVLSSGYADEYYYKALAAREKMKQELDSVFEDVDLILTPTTPSVAFKFGEKSDPISMYASDIFTVPVNIAGVPAISLPFAEHELDGKSLPLGAQFIAPKFHDLALLDFAIDFERRRG